MTRFVEVPREAVCGLLDSKGFVRAVNTIGEIVYERAHSRRADLKVRVYTSISTQATEARGCGEDAIRVVLVWRGPHDAGLYRAARVFRTGSVEKVLARMLDRMRECYGVANEIVKRGPCKACGAPCYADSGRCVVRECRERRIA